MVLKIHEAKSFPGGIIASLSIPWGFAKGDDDLGGYHLVWPRDLVEAAGGLLAGGATEEAHRVLTYLQATQEADGHWPQNMWLDGSSYWTGIQMDETALPILLVDLAARSGALTEEDLTRLWPTVRRAASFIVRFGPVSDQDRWEEDPGYTPFTIAAEVAALLVAADLADRQGEPEAGAYLRETADVWNQSVERWMYVTGTDLAAECEVDGYYVRIAPPETADAASPASGFVPIKNRPPGQSREPATEIVSVDALALVRFGLARPDDPRIVNTVKVIDRLLRVELPQGPGFRRYNEDGYGEHEDGSPFDGTGIGRAWPLLTAERAHYELAAGRVGSSSRPGQNRGAVGQRRRHVARTDLGWSRPSRAGTVHGPSFGFGDAVGVGPCRVPETQEVIARRPGVRHAPPAGSALSERPNGVPVFDLAVQPQVPDDARGRGATGRGASTGRGALVE